MRGADGVIGHDGELALLERPLRRGTTSPIERGSSVVDDLRLLECRMFGPLQHEVHRDRQENRSRGLSLACR